MTTYTIADVFLVNGQGYNGALVSAYKASRFGSPPIQNQSPSGAPDAGPVTTSTTFGSPGAFQIVLPTNEDYYYVVQYGAQYLWKLHSATVFSDAGGGSLALQSNLTVAGTTTVTGLLSANGGLIVTGNDVDSGLVTAQAFSATGLGNATTGARFVGGTASGPPTTGTFAADDYVVDQLGRMWICTVGGTPGTWTTPNSIGASAPMATTNVNTAGLGGVAIAAPTYDDYNAFSSSIYTVPVAGRWFVYLSLLFAGGAAGRVPQCAILYNGVQLAVSRGQLDAYGYATIQCLLVQNNCVVGDAFQPAATCNPGTGTVTISNDGTQSYMRVWKG